MNYRDKGYGSRPNIETKWNYTRTVVFDCGYCGKSITEHRATAWTANGRDLERFENYHRSNAAMTDERMVVEVRDVLDAVPGSMLFGAGLFLNGSRLPVTVLSHVADNVDGSVWLADGWAERITPQ